jgi:hypothetical protein
MTRDYSSKETSGLSDQTIPNVRANICKMAKCMALKTNNILIPALRLENLTRSDLERLQLLWWRSKLVLFGTKPTDLSNLPTLSYRLRVGRMLFVYMRFGVFNRLIDPLRGTDRPITPRNGVTSKMVFSIYSVLMVEEEAEAFLVNRLSP